MTVTVITSLGPRFISWLEGPRGFELPVWGREGDSPVTGTDKRLSMSSAISDAFPDSLWSQAMTCAWTVSRNGWSLRTYVESIGWYDLDGRQRLLRENHCYLFVRNQRLEESFLGELKMEGIVTVRNE